MPRYLPPGLYTKEVTRPPRITGVTATTAAFIGPAWAGPVDRCVIVHGLEDFERVYGNFADFDWDGRRVVNHLWFAARAYFAQGGQRLAVVRVKDGSGIEGCADLPPRAPGLKDYVAALNLLEDVDDISTVAAPGSTAEDTPLGAGVAAALIDHAQRMRHRFALIDSIAGQDVTQVQHFRAGFDSKHAALYYPWVSMAVPETGAPRLLPPSGFVAGIIARVDAARGVARAPANEEIGLAVGLERDITDGEQQVLNPLGINALRFFNGRGYRVWGARTLSSDPEWKYVNVRRYVSFLEQAMEKGLGWVAFEPNAAPLWKRVTATVTTFLTDEWRGGNLIGAARNDAFFVRCDATTMTSADIDAGRLVCQIGLALLKPAEFHVLRIEVPTGSAAP